MYTVGFLFAREVMTYEYEGLLFVWHGGEYIDVCVATDEKDEAAFRYYGNLYVYSSSNINVWDYDKGGASIEWLDSVAFISECEEWMNE
jgi:hypothetical protein